jgi:hypothetical protein
MHDGTITLDYMPAQFITFRLETGYRYSDEPYWTGHGGITPPGGNGLNPADYVCAGSNVDAGFGYGSLASAEANCQALGFGPVGTGVKPSTANIWWPDLRTNQTVTTIAIMVRF